MKLTKIEAMVTDYLFFQFSVFMQESPTKIGDEFLPIAKRSFIDIARIIKLDLPKSMVPNHKILQFSIFRNFYLVEWVAKFASILP